jgi:hypothetical protein
MGIGAQTISLDERQEFELFEPGDVTEGRFALFGAN